MFKQISVILLFIGLAAAATPFHWMYHQSTGVLSHDGVNVGHGYSGMPPYKDDPKAQCIKMEGPLPRGQYKIGPAQTHPRLGPIAMELTPIGGQDMCGRSEFFIHGDSSAHPGRASEGCIVMPGDVREKVAASPDRILNVVL